MRKTGIATLAAGLVLTLLLVLIRQSEWFATEQARGLSDFAELTESAFRASLVTVLLGLVFLLLSLRVTRQVPDNDVPAPLERFWVCPACGAQNSEQTLHCTVCGNPQGNAPDPTWTCPVCGAENPASAAVCPICQTPPTGAAETWVCEVCGQENPETEDRCLACQRRRYPVEPDWTCPVCGTANEAGIGACVLCGTLRQGDRWTCSFCRHENPDRLRVCDVCGKPRTAQRQSWLCPVCGTQNRADRTACIDCGHVPTP